jgi:hypothetical protein
MSLSVNFWCYVDGGRFVCSIRLRVADWRLHPLIHTLLDFNVAQYVVSRQKTACIAKKTPPPTRGTKLVGASTNCSHRPAHLAAGN